MFFVRMCLRLVTPVYVQSNLKKKNKNKNKTHGFSFKFLQFYNPKVYSIRERFVFQT